MEKHGLPLLNLCYIPTAGDRESRRSAVAPGRVPDRP